MSYTFAKRKTKQLMTALVLGMALLAITAGCSKPAEAPVEPTPPTPPAPGVTAFVGDYIATPEYVKTKLNDPNLLLIDARGEEEAAKGTISGAIAVPWQGLAMVDGKSGDAMWGTILEPQKLSEALSALGISQEKEIILFAAAANGWGDDGRILWELKAAGFTNLKMVDGGYDGLIAAGLPTVKGGSAPTPAAVSVASIDNTNLINTDDLKASYDTFKIVDVRADEEYNGKTLYGEAKGGHLPGAIHIKFTDLFNADNTLKSNEEITKIFADNGITKADKVVTYCTAGIRSAYMQLVMEMCGFDTVQNYDESYYRWAATNEVE